MVKAVRSRLADRGLDPRHNALLSYGGSGSLFTPDIARAIGSPRVVIPELASVLSAFGAATADVRRERLRSVLAPMPVDPMLIRKLMDELGDEVRADLAADGIPTDGQSVTYEADLRFSRQIWEIQIPLDRSDLDAAALDRLLDAFRQEYAKRYGQGSIVLGAPIELVSLRAIGIGRTTQATLDGGGRTPVPDGTPAVPATTRPVRVDRGPDGWRDVDVYDSTGLQPGHAVSGPALVDGSDTTIWVPSGATGRIDTVGMFVMEVGA
jgi:N-methylhydantoinase A